MTDKTPILPKSWPNLYQANRMESKGLEQINTMTDSAKDRLDDGEEINTKKDAFWKTILRLFRRHLKSEANLLLATSKDQLHTVQD